MNRKLDFNHRNINTQICITLIMRMIITMMTLDLE